MTTTTKYWIASAAVSLVCVAAFFQAIRQRGANVRQDQANVRDVGLNVRQELADVRDFSVGSAGANTRDALIRRIELLEEQVKRLESREPQIVYQNVEIHPGGEIEKETIDARPVDEVTREAAEILVAAVRRNKAQWPTVTQSD